ncbi:putative twin-arginine translocation pathway signal protein [Burkholderia pseudomallei]|nr:putative twin-arginine translocation pathway signal protein [Burkholderia pseudomallei]
MNTNSDLVLPASVGPTVAIDAGKVCQFKFERMAAFSLLCALLATAASLAIASFAGWQRGGLTVERAMNVTLGCVAVLYVHLLPRGWRLLGVTARLCAFAMWCVGVAVVLYGQVSFFMLSERHAGDERAASIMHGGAPPGAVVQAGRTRTQIALDVEKVTTDLARSDARRCKGDCPGLTVRRQTLAAQLAALNTEADEAMRREADEDRRVEQADRYEALQASLRADPVASVVASWLHTSGSRLELILAFACAVVLEGSAILGWMLVSIAGGRVSDRAMVVSGRETVAMSRCDAVTANGTVARQREFPIADHTVSEGEPSTVVCASAVTVATNGATDSVADERRLEQIRNAVLAGTLVPTQESIRKLLRCRQPTAGRLNRLYADRFGSQAMQAATQAGRGQYANR